MGQNVCQRLGNGSRIEAGLNSEAGIPRLQKPLVFRCPELGLVGPMERHGLGHLVAPGDEDDRLKPPQEFQLICLRPGPDAGKLAVVRLGAKDAAGEGAAGVWLV